MKNEGKSFSPFLKNFWTKFKYVVFVVYLVVIIISELEIDSYLMPNEQFFSNIMVTTIYIRWDDDVRFALDLLKTVYKHVQNNTLIAVPHLEANTTFNKYWVGGVMFVCSSRVQYIMSSSLDLVNLKTGGWT
jgi:hypothetical protein